MSKLDLSIPEDLSIPAFLKVENRVPLTPERQKAWDAWAKTGTPLPRFPGSARTVQPTAAAEAGRPRTKRLRLAREDHNIVMLIDKNPCIVGKRSHAQFELLRKSRTVRGFIAQGGHQGWVAISLKKNWIKLT
jgi:hypothetical protein